MCGGFKRNDETWGSKGEYFKVVTNNGTFSGMFNGHAREETLKEKWLSNGWKRCDIKVAGYTENGRKYEVPKGRVLKGIGRKIGKKVVFNVVTRQARGAELEVHDRFPIISVPRW